MPSPTLAKIRERFPDLDDVPDNELTVRIGNTYPKLLDEDEASTKVTPSLPLAVQPAKLGKRFRWERSPFWAKLDGVRLRV